MKEPKFLDKAEKVSNIKVISKDSSSFKKHEII
jgi:hypothetical protein